MRKCRSVHTRLAEGARDEGLEFLDKGDAELAEEEPGAEGPGRVVLVCDVEVVGHFIVFFFSRRDMVGLE